MYANNVVMNPLDHSGGWYLPQPSSPPNGLCGTAASQGSARTTMFTDVNFTKNDAGTATAQGLFGITACPAHFTVSTLSDLGLPVPNGGNPEIRKFSQTADAEDLHELFHLVSDGGTFV